MKEKKKSFICKFLGSMRVRVFSLVFIAIIVPLIVFGVIIAVTQRNNYKTTRLDKFTATNTMIKNVIVSEGYVTNPGSEAVNAQINQACRQFNCRIEVINNAYTIIKDTDAGNEGKTSISENVIKCLDGNEVVEENNDKNYIEYAIPIYSLSSNVQDKKKETVAGCLYVNYSLKDVDDFSGRLHRTLVVLYSALIILALVFAWYYSLYFTKPLNRIENMLSNLNENDISNLAEKDFVEIREISSNFAKLIEKMNTQDKSREEFVSNVSHELKTPITSMKVLADSLLGQTGVDEELYQEFLSDISKEIDRENDIITDLLTLVRMDKSDSVINIAPTNINEIVESVLRRLKPIAEIKNIELIFESFRPVVADVDGTKISSVVNNLVENAIKYNNNDGMVTVSLNSDHQYFYFKVQDNGIGISEENQRHVFERFYRVDKARSRETGGTGLGLAITRDIVLKHHGSIKIHSKEEEGTTFTVRIPLKYIS